MVVVLVLMTSGHWAGNVVGASVNAFAGPALTLLFILFGLMLMLRRLAWQPRRRYRPDYREGGWRYGRW